MGLRPLWQGACLSWAPSGSACPVWRAQDSQRASCAGSMRRQESIASLECVCGVGMSTCPCMCVCVCLLVKNKGQRGAGISLSTLVFETGPLSEPRAVDVATQPLRSSCPTTGMTQVANSLTCIGYWDLNSGPRVVSTLLPRVVSSPWIPHASLWSCSFMSFTYRF